MQSLKPPRQSLLETARAISALAESLNTSYNGPDVTTSDRLEATQLFAGALRTLRAVVNIFNDEITDAVADAGLDRAVIAGSDGADYTVTVTKKKIHKDVDREGIVRAVERLSAEPVHRLIPDSGELMDQNAAKVQLFQKMFRMEPRWGELRKAGIDDDEYARVGWTQSSAITKAERFDG